MHVASKQCVRLQIACTQQGFKNWINKQCVGDYCFNKCADESTAVLSHPRTHVSRVSLYRYLLLAVDHRTGTLVANPLLPSIRQIKTTLGCAGERRSSRFHPLPPVAALLAESAPPYHSCFILIWWRNKRNKMIRVPLWPYASCHRSFVMRHRPLRSYRLPALALTMHLVCHMLPPNNEGKWERRA